MSKDQRASAPIRSTPEPPAPDRDLGVLETRPVDRAIEDAIEDDEVREALRLHQRGKQP